MKKKVLKSRYELNENRTFFTKYNFYSFGGQIIGRKEKKRSTSMKRVNKCPYRVK